jgi:hypothetical protein
MHGSSLEVERGKGSEMAPARAESPQPSARARRLAPTLPQLWALVTLGGIFALLGLWLVHPNDFWWHVRAGGWIVDHGRLPWVDLFSFTRAGEPWAYQSWLMEVVFYLLLRAGDLPLVIFLNAVAGRPWPPWPLLPLAPPTGTSAPRPCPSSCSPWPCTLSSGTRRFPPEADLGWGATGRCGGWCRCSPYGPTATAGSFLA